MNLFMLFGSSITGDSEKGDDLCLFFIFFGDHYFFEQHNTISNAIDHYFTAVFTQFRLKICINIKYLKNPLTFAKLSPHKVWETLIYTIKSNFVCVLTPANMLGVET